jgi:hypothetical protein
VVRAVEESTALTSRTRHTRLTTGTFANIFKRCSLLLRNGKAKRHRTAATNTNTNTNDRLTDNIAMAPNKPKELWNRHDKYYHLVLKPRKEAEKAKVIERKRKEAERKRIAYHRKKALAMSMSNYETPQRGGNATFTPVASANTNPPAPLTTPRRLSLAPGAHGFAATPDGDSLSRAAVSDSVSPIPRFRLHSLPFVFSTT